MNSGSPQRVLKFRAPWLLLSYQSGQGLDQLGEDIENLGRPPGFFYVQKSVIPSILAISRQKSVFSAKCDFDVDSAVALELFFIEHSPA